MKEASRAQGSRVEEHVLPSSVSLVDPKPGEYELEELLPRSEHEVLVATANEARKSLLPKGSARCREQCRGGAFPYGDRRPQLGDIADTLSDACISLEDCANELRAYRDGVAFDPRDSLLCASGIPTSRACCVSGVPPWTTCFQCAITRKSCYRW
ncbi:MAG: hypothetical protein ACLU0O_04770 [Collinsella sp.]